SHKSGVLGCAHGSMMQAVSLHECSRLPSPHARGDDGDVIDAATLDWNISSDLFKALTAKYLARAGDVLDANEAIVIGPQSAVEKRRSHQPKFGIAGQLVQQKLEVIGAKGYVCVQAGDHLEWQMPHPGVSGIESMNLAGKMTLPSLR